MIFYKVYIIKMPLLVQIININAKILNNYLIKFLKNELNKWSKIYIVLKIHL
jgi:hypothetical protein